MTVIEMRFMETVCNYLPRLVHELEKLNFQNEEAKEKSDASSKND